MIGRQEDGATQRHNGLETADGARERGRIRALGKRVAVTRPEVNGVLRIDPYPPENDPKKKVCNFLGGELSPLRAHLALHSLRPTAKRHCPAGCKPRQ